MVRANRELLLVQSPKPWLHRLMEGDAVRHSTLLMFVVVSVTPKIASGEDAGCNSAPQFPAVSLLATTPFGQTNVPINTLLRYVVESEDGGRMLGVRLFGPDGGFVPIDIASEGAAGPLGVALVARPRQLLEAASRYRALFDDGTSGEFTTGTLTQSGVPPAPTGLTVKLTNPDSLPCSGFAVRGYSWTPDGLYRVTENNVVIAAAAPLGPGIWCSTQPKPKYLGGLFFFPVSPGAHRYSVQALDLADGVSSPVALEIDAVCPAPAPSQFRFGCQTGPDAGIALLCLTAIAILRARPRATRG